MRVIMLLAGQILLASGLLLAAFRPTAMPQGFLEYAYGGAILGGLAVTGSYATIHLLRSSKAKNFTPSRPSASPPAVLGGFREASAPNRAAQVERKTKLVGLPRVISKICPACSGQSAFASAYCEHCGFSFESMKEGGLRLTASVPQYVTHENLPTRVELIYDDLGRLYGTVVGRGDPLRSGREGVQVKSLKGFTQDIQIDRFILSRSASAPGSPDGALILMPEWFTDSNVLMSQVRLIRDRLIPLAEAGVKAYEVGEEVSILEACRRIWRQLGRVEPRRIRLFEQNLARQAKRIDGVRRSSLKAEFNHAVLEDELQVIKSCLLEIEATRGQIRALKDMSTGTHSRAVLRMILEAIPQI